MGKLDGKVALITGSGRNIGRATALKFAGEGANVVVNARANQQEAESVAREVRDLGVKAVADPRRCRQQGRGRGAGGEGAVRIRPGRHPDQQRRDPAAQAVHRSDRRGLGAGPQRRAGRRVLPDARADRVDGQEQIRPHFVLLSATARFRPAAAAAPTCRRRRWG